MKAAAPIAFALALSFGGAPLAQVPSLTAKPSSADALFSGNTPTFDPAIEVGFAVVNVADMAKSVAFYKQLGLTVTLTAVAHSGVPGTPESKDVPMTLFQTARGVASSGLHLVQHNGPVTLGTAYNRLGIRVADAIGVCKSLAEAGTPCLREPRVSRRNNMTIAVAWARDPDGRLLELVQHN
jgi:catechol 2,3-dioxygenase-like lactoylglutathione lyase family enzyme